MNKVQILSFVILAFTLGACDHYSTKLAMLDSNETYINVSEITPASGGDMTFRGHLAEEYLELARYEENTKRDYRAAKYYTDKIEILNGGQIVSPASLNDFEIGGDKAPLIEMERKNLLNALTTYNIPENRAALAKAQSRYDCWLEQLEETQDIDTPLTCKVEYQRAMASLVQPLGRDMRFSIPFNQDGTLINQQSNESIERVLSLWRNNQENVDIRINLLPASGLGLVQQQKRVSMVRSLLQYNGIPANQIKLMDAQNSDGEKLIPKNNFEIIVSIPQAPKPII